MKKSPPSAFVELIETQKAEAEKDRIKWEHIHREEDAEEATLYKKFKKALQEYDGVTIDKHDLSIKTIPEKNTVQLFIDKQLWMSFRVKRHFGSCSCENVCDCPRSTWISLESIQHRKAGEYGAYFSCGEFSDDKAFAHAIKQVMIDYSYEHR
jgi:hypothetical protein